MYFIDDERKRIAYNLNLQRQLIEYIYLSNRDMCFLNKGVEYIKWDPNKIYIYKQIQYRKNYSPVSA